MNLDILFFFIYGKKKEILRNREQMFSISLDTQMFVWYNGGTGNKLI